MQQHEKAHAPSAPPAESDDNVPYAVAVPVAMQVGARADEAAQQAARESMQGLREGAWEVGLCGCFTHCVPNCLMVTFCPCISVAQISSKLGVTSYAFALIFFLVVFVADYVVFGVVMGQMTANNWIMSSGTSDWDEMDDESYGFGAVLRVVQVVADVAVVVFVWQLRSKTRERFQIPGGCCADCWISICCSCCSLAQMATHLKTYEPGSCRFGAPRDTLLPYK